jgi:integrase
MKLTANAVKTLTSDKSDAIFFDDELKGFGYRVRVGAGGKVLRSWIVQYRHRLGHRRMTVGSAAALTAEQARGKAKELLAKVALGDDPQGDRRGRRDKDRLTLRFVIDEFLAAKTAKLRPTTLREIRRYFTGPYFRKLHGMPIDRVSRRDVALCLSAIEREHGPIVRAVARAKANSLFVWAMRQGVTEHNPVIGTEPPERSAPRERVLSDAELADIWRACGDDDHGRIVRLLILLGTRRAEIGGMRWSEIDLDAGTWTLPKDRSKNKREHTLPLPATALAIIRSVPMRATRNCLFGQRSGAGFMGWDEGKAALDARSAVRNWVVHDIRRTFSTRLHDLGVLPHIVEQLLNHQAHRAGAARNYNWSKYEPQVRTALSMWEDHIRILIEGSERRVLAFPPQNSA